MLNYFSKVRRFDVEISSISFGFLGIPAVCKSTHLEKLRNSPRVTSNRRNQRQMTNGNSEMIDFSQMTDAEILKTTMTGFSEVIW